jgi:carbon-monoxide dehydrogenase large subunit
MPDIVLEDSARRREDVRFVTGTGRYTSDIQPDGLAHAVFVRSPYAHAHVRGIDATSAEATPGVIAILTGADLVADGLGAMPTSLATTRPDGTPSPKTERFPLVPDTVRSVGEPVAIVIAETAAQAMDAAELVDVSYEDLPAVTDAREALAPEAPRVWPDRSPDNVGFHWSKGDAARVDEIMAGAHHTTRLDITISRVTANSIEPRTVMCNPSEAGKLVLYTSSQGPFQMRDALCTWMKATKDGVRVICPDVGGSFGMKSGLYREDAAIAWAAKRLGRPVRWVATRSEGMLTDDQARDLQVSAALALDADGIFLGLKARCDLNLGAYLTNRSLNLFGNIGGIAGMYRTAEIAIEIYGVLTNTTITAPYRGAGRPEATYIIERLIDRAAREMGIDKFELRRRNLIAERQMPFKTPLIFTYDCGDFGAVMAEAERLADVAGFPARRAEAAARGRLRGIGVANPIEAASGPALRPSKDMSQIVVRADGTLTLSAGGMSVGQGHETVFPELVAARLGIAPERIGYVMGDSDALSFGRGNGGSGGAGTSGSAVLETADDVIAKGKAVAAKHLDAQPDDLEFRDGRFLVKATNRGMTLAETAAAAGGTFTGSAVFQPPAPTFPNGTHICEVEVDPETGVVELARYTACEDVGNVLKSQLVHGQLHGGIAQGVGQALMEFIAHDDSGQQLTGSFMDYAMPHAEDLPSFNLGLRAVPTASNPLGAKGVGEAGTVGGMAATMSAVIDALGAVGVEDLNMPASPFRVWAAIQRTKAGSQ